MNNLLKYIPAMATCLLLSCNGLSQSGAMAGGDLSVKAFNEKIVTLENEQILDVRTPEEWADGIIANAHKINFYEDDFEQQVSKLDKTKPIMVYCAKGVRSSKAMNKMKAWGFTEVYNLEGGMDAWRGESFEVVK